MIGLLSPATKGGVKVHIVLENDTFLPVWAWISEAVRHDKVIFDFAPI
jgi:hypothetical protein